MEESKDKHVNSASGNMVKSKLRYPLRSALKSKEGKPPAPEFSGSSGSRRGRTASTVSQSTTALDLSAKDDKSAKPPRRFSIPAKSLGNSAGKSLGNITPISETRAKRSNNAWGKIEAPVSSAPRSATRRKVDDLSSTTYWLSQIKLSESAAKHSISLGFFKLAQQSGCEPFQQIREELKSYARRNNLEDLKDAVKELCEIYDILEEPKQLQVSEACSIIPEETMVSVNEDVHSSSYVPEDVNVTPESLKDNASQGSTVTRTAKKENALKNIPQERTRRSLAVNAVTPEDVSEVQGSEEGTRSSHDGLKGIPAQASAAKRTAKKEVVPKNNPPGRARKSLTNSSANSRILPETRGDRSQRKAERITKPRTKTNQEEKRETKKREKKSAGKEGQVMNSEEASSTEENKENSVATVAEEIQVE